MTTVLITGANRGIGLEFVRQYAVEGAAVIACCRNPARASELHAIDGNVRVMPLDVSNSSSIHSLKERLEGEAIDILINNAGIGYPIPPVSYPVPSNEWLGVFAVNSIAPVAVAYALHDNLMKGQEKKLVTITSICGSVADHPGGTSAYHASKAALNSFMHGLSMEWTKEGIVFGLLHPGWVQTDMGGMDATTTPQESVTGLRARIAEMSTENSGTFRDFENQVLPW